MEAWDLGACVDLIYAVAWSTPARVADLSSALQKAAIWARHASARSWWLLTPGVAVRRVPGKNSAHAAPKLTCIHTHVHGIARRAQWLPRPATPIPPRYRSTARHGMGGDGGLTPTRPWTAPKSL